MNTTLHKTFPKLHTDQQLQHQFYRWSQNKDLFDKLLDQTYENQCCQNDVTMELQVQESKVQAQDDEVGCRCTKIGCLKMYCVCFSKGRMCTSKCICNSCQNNECHSHELTKAKQIANSRHPSLFKDIPQMSVKKCTCKKSGCRKNYCECYRNGLKCSQQCECNDCHNEKNEFPPKSAPETSQIWVIA